MSETVRRRLSSGFLPVVPLSSEPDSPDLSFHPRPDSSAGLRALTCSVGPAACGRREILRSIVVTPDTIPQFTIPKLAGDRRTQAGRDTACILTQDFQLLSSVSSTSSSSSSLFSSSPVLGRKARRSISDPSTHRRTSVRCVFMKSDQCSDPTTRGALSLPHLPKITTPYGFVTLSQSPQMANEEELLLQVGHRAWARGEENMPTATLNSLSQRTLPVQGFTVTASRQVSRGTSNPETSECSGSGPSPAVASRPKQSFWEVLRKHFST